MSKRSAYDAALRLLGVRARSMHEMRNRLRGKRFAEAEVEAAIARLCEADLLNDETFARYVCESVLGKRPVGARLLAHRLLRRGVAQDIAERVIADVLPKDRERRLAEQAAEQYQRRLSSDLPASAKKARIARHLASRGFSMPAEILDEAA